MRRTLALVSLAVTSMVAIALLIPLAIAIRQLAGDQALADARRQLNEIAPAVAISPDRATLGSVVAASGGSICVLLPDGGRLGRPLASPAQVAAARGQGGETQVPAQGKQVIIQAVPTARGGTAVVEVAAPDRLLPPGVATAWAITLAVAVCLLAGSVLVADRLGARVVGAARRLAAAARALGSGDLTDRVDPDGPPELRDAGHAFNAMADRVVQQLAAERELAADLSHRLRTPLTALRLNIDALGHSFAAEQAGSALARLEREVDVLIRTTRRSGGDAEPGTCDASEVVRDRLNFWSALAEDQGRPWRLNGADQPARVPVGGAELAATLDSLLGNVFHHTPEGTAFAVTLQVGTDRVGVLVSDAGAGIASPQAALQRGRSGVGSTGLGLDIARRLAQSTGGELRVGRSTMGGAQVAVWLRTVGAAYARRPPTARRRRHGGTVHSHDRHAS